MEGDFTVTAKEGFGFSVNAECSLLMDRDVGHNTERGIEESLLCIITAFYGVPADDLLIRKLFNSSLTLLAVLACCIIVGSFQCGVYRLRSCHNWVELGKG